MKTKDTFKKITILCKIFGCDLEVTKFILAQTMLETGNFKSKIYKENNNLFGMKKAKQRITTATDEQNEHAKYLCESYSILDYFIWLSYFGFTQEHLKNLEKFKLRLINSGYCPHEDYIKRIEQIYKQIKIEQQ